MTTPDWQSWCRRHRDLEVTGAAVLVTLPTARKHRVSVKSMLDTIEFEGVVASSGALERVPDVELRAWRRNRSAQRVSFRFDTKGRLVADGWIPLTGLTADEFLGTLRRVAAEADLFEHQLTGKDRE